jgi:hypothetical protein
MTIQVDWDVPQHCLAQGIVSSTITKRNREKVEISPRSLCCKQTGRATSDRRQALSTKEQHEETYRLSETKQDRGTQMEYATESS